MTAHTNYVSTNTKPLLKSIPEIHRTTYSHSNSKDRGAEQYDIKIDLESVHYTGKDYGYGWTFVMSIMQHHWISSRIQMRQGQKSVVDKTIYKNVVRTRFYNIQHLPIDICIQHNNGLNIETTLHLRPNSFKKITAPTSIYTELQKQNEGFKFHELHTVDQDDAQLMFVFNVEISPLETAIYKN